MSAEGKNRQLAREILECALGDRAPGEILQCSLDQEAFGGPDERDVVPHFNGFVSTVVACYCEHRALVIRPDDVWLAILTQFNLFVNANAEQLRSHFVSHEGQKELVISVDGGNRYTVDFGSMSRQMGDLIQENIVDDGLREWIIPDFSTTTVTDTTVASMIMMATLKVNYALV